MDIVCDTEQGIPIRSDSLDLLLSKYLIEHLSWRTVQKFLNECYRVLKKGGHLILFTADLKQQCAHVLDHEPWSLDTSSVIFGGQETPQHSHKCGFSPDLMERLLTQAGFERVSVVPHWLTPTDMIAQGWK